MSRHAPGVLVAREEGVIDDAVVRAALPPGSAARFVTLADAAARALALLDDPAVGLVVVCCAGHSDHALRVIAAATAQPSDRAVIVLHAGVPNGFLALAFAAGADDLVVLPQGSADLAFAVEKALARRRGAVQPGRLGDVVTVLGPKGGTGKTLTTVNLAVALQAEGARTVIVDLYLQFGDVGLALGLDPAPTIADLAAAPGSLDADKLESYLVAHGCGVHVLLAPVRPDQASAIGVPFIREVLELLRTRFDAVVVDTPPAFSPEVIAAIDGSTRLCMVAMLDALSLKDSKIGLETLAHMGYARDEVLLVLSRADSDVGISRSDVERLLSRRPDVSIPSDRAIPKALTRGVPIVLAAPRSTASRELTALAQRLLRERAEADLAGGDTSLAWEPAATATAPPPPPPAPLPASSSGRWRLALSGRKA